MPPLLNRVPTGRLICLHALLQHLSIRYSNNNFTLRGAQYDPESDKTIHDTCTLLVEKGASRTKVCPFLENPLSEAKCYLTQSILLDTQKQKSVGDAVNGLEALGLVDRIDGGFRINSLGSDMARVDYYSKEWLQCMRKRAVSYGLFLGFLYIATQLAENGISERSQLKPRLAFPETGDMSHDLFGNAIRISTGCEVDTMTRTTSLLMKWGATLGYVSEPKELNPGDMSHVKTLEAVKGENMARRFRIHFSQEDMKNIFVERPIHYPFLTPDAGARRDLPATERRVSMQMSPKVINRRYALIYALGLGAQRELLLNFVKLKEELKKRSDFVVDVSNMDNAINLEMNTVIIAGMPWKKESGSGLIEPLVKMNLSYLSTGAPKNIVDEVKGITDTGIYERRK